MYQQRPGEAASRSRFWLALSLSTVTAAAVAAPLALKAVSFDSRRDPAAPIGGSTVPVTAPDSPTTIELPGIGAGDGRDGRGNIVPEPATTDEIDDPVEPSTPTTRAPTTTVPEPPPTTTTTTPPTTSSIPTTSSTTTETTSTTTAGESTSSTSSSSTTFPSIPETTAATTPTVPPVGGSDEP